MIYLDNAATSFPKSPSFHANAAAILGAPWGNPNRGAHRASVQSEELIWRCRSRLARLIGAAVADSIVIGYNTTDLLNTAIGGVFQRFRLQVAITSAMEHNSVLRPLYRLAERGASLQIGVPDESGEIDLRAQLEQAAGHCASPALVVLSHVSNTTGCLRDIARAGRLCREYGAYLVVDGAQSVGSLAVDVIAMNADALVFPAHKGLLGPTGLGFLYLGPRLLHAGLEPLRVGGGGDATLHAVSMAAPGRFESGTPNIHGLMLLEQSLDWLERHPDNPADRLALALRQNLKALGPVHVYGGHGGAGSAGVVLCNVAQLPSQTVAAILDQDFGIATRAGLHCAPLAHAWLGTDRSHDGAVRISLGKFNTDEDVTAVTVALERIAHATLRGRA